MHRLTILLALCACGGAASNATPQEPPLCTDLRAFAASKVSRESPCPPATCEVSPAGVNCVGTALTSEDGKRTCTEFKIGKGCTEVCPPAQCAPSTEDGVEQCDDGQGRCGFSNTTCYVLDTGISCPN